MTLQTAPTFATLAGASVLAGCVGEPIVVSAPDAVTLPVEVDVARYTFSTFTLTDTYQLPTGSIQALYTITDEGRPTFYGVELVDCGAGLMSSYGSGTEPRTLPVGLNTDRATGQAAFGAHLELLRVACAVEGQTLRVERQ